LAGKKTRKRRHTFRMASFLNALSGQKNSFQAFVFLSHRAFRASVFLKSHSLPLKGSLMMQYFDSLRRQPLRRDMYNAPYP